MAGDFIEYVKNGWDSIVNASENDEKRKVAMAELEAYLNGLSENKLPDKPKLPELPEYDRMEYEPPSDDEIAESAESGLGEYRNSGINSIENEIAGLKKKYETDKAAADEGLKDKNSVLDEAYGEAKRNTDGDMLKRGIARSSIAANKGAELEGAQAKMKTDVYNRYSAELSRIDGEISGLESKRGKALDDFNISYAAKLTKTINELKADRNDKAAEVLKYNNGITEKRSQAEIDKLMKESDLYGEALSQKEKENALKGDSAANQNLATYNKMSSTLRSMNKNDARKLLMESDIFKANLDSKHYYMLYDEFIR